MFKNISLRLRITIITAVLISISCMGLMIVLNLTVNRLTDNIATVIEIVPPNDVNTNNSNELDKTMFNKTINDSFTKPSLLRQSFRMESIIYTLIIVIISSCLVYYVTLKSLKPLNYLNKKIKLTNINNLSIRLDVPNTKDEIASLTESFNEMIGKIEKSYINQKQFSNNIAHELRTPLAVIQTKIDVFNKKEVDTKEEYKDLLNIINNQTKRLRNLVENVLNLANLDVIVEKQEILLKDLLEEILIELKDLLKEKEIIVSKKYEDIKFFGNKQLIFHAIYNIMENAIKYNKQKGKINIILTEDEKNISLSISDSGIGILKEEQEKIFETFYRLNKNIKGNGLGLYISKTIIEKHNGLIKLESEEKKGSKFTIKFKK